MVAVKKRIDLQKFKEIKMMERFNVHPFNKRLIYWIVHFMDPIEDDEPKEASSSFSSSILPNALPTNSNNEMNNGVVDTTSW